MSLKNQWRTLPASKVCFSALVFLVSLIPLQTTRGRSPADPSTPVASTSAGSSNKASPYYPQAAPRRLTKDGYFKQRPLFSPDGKKLLFTRHKDDKLWLYLLEPATGEEKRLTKREEPEYDGVWMSEGASVIFTHVSFSGTQGDLDLHRISLGQEKTERLVGTQNGLSHEEWPSLSPDGKKIAFSSTRYGNQEIALSNVDGKNETRLTSHLGTDAHPCWSPDGKLIAFATDRWGGLELALMKPDGSDVRRLTTSPGLDDYPVWSPDGKWLAFVSHREGNFDVFVMPSGGGEAANLTHSPAVEMFPSWTKDGQGLVFVSNHEGVQFDLYLWDKINLTANTSASVPTK